MSIKKLALTAIAATVLATPTLASANAQSINANYLTTKQSSYDKHVRNVRANRHARHAGNIRTPGIDRRIDRQRDRIRNGRRVGDLTWFEARKLRKSLRRIVRARAIAKFDGDVTRFERRELRDMLNVNSKRIARLRHNNRTANPRFRKFRKYIDFNY